MKYKIKDCFEIKDIAGDKIVIARGEIATEFNGVLILNDSCIFLWDKMKDFVSVNELAQALVAEYGIDGRMAEEDAQALVNKLFENGVLDIEE